ncbi:MAG: hypothetical protein KDE33_11270 [Bacteroidetes bacterium]|nr:hypothetical protein [Bacteroidota bacterium]
MALFDFLKSKEQREQEKVFQELTDQIFPGGKTQIEEEVKEIRIAIDYRYPKDEIYKAYLHAACLFYVSDDKSEERIINSMLNHENSVLSKGDAKMIYLFLVGKFAKELMKDQAVSAFSKMSLEEKLYTVAKSGVVELKNNFTGRDLSKGGRFEVLLLNLLIVMNEVNEIQEYSERLPRIVNRIHELLFSDAINEYKVVKPSDGDLLTKFVNSRMDFYSEELNKLNRSRNYTPMLIYTAIFDQNLEFEINPKGDFNVTELVNFNIALKIMIDWVMKHSRMQL